AHLLHLARGQPRIRIEPGHLLRRAVGEAAGHHAVAVARPARERAVQLGDAAVLQVGKLRRGRAEEVDAELNALLRARAARAARRRDVHAAAATCEDADGSSKSDTSKSALERKDGKLTASQENT